MEQSPNLFLRKNETNTERLYGTKAYTPYVKNGIERWLIEGEENGVNPDKRGTISAAHYELSIPAGESVSIDLRLYAETEARNLFWDSLRPHFLETH